VKIGANLEFAKTDGLNAVDAIEKAAGAGFKYVEPYLYCDVEIPLNSHVVVANRASYYHFDAKKVEKDTLLALCRRLGVEFSAVDAHCSLLLPQFSIVYLKSAIDFAAATNCPFVVCDEGPLSLDWMDLEKAFDVMCFTLEEVINYAKKNSVTYAMELHNALTARSDYLVKLLGRFGSDELGVNFDTGNCFLAGNDPVEYLELVVDRVVHVHVKDIPESQLEERGKVTGTRVGVAAGDGVVDLAGIIKTLGDAGYDGILSVECDTFEQAEKSLAFLAGICRRQAKARGV
jgi:sugar phosphate isomerase/epimerase